MFSPLKFFINYEFMSRILVQESLKRNKLSFNNNYYKLKNLFNKKLTKLS